MRGEKKKRVGEGGEGGGGEGGGESLYTNFHVSSNYHYNAKANGSWTKGELHSDSEN